MKYVLEEPVIITGNSGTALTEIRELEFREKVKAKDFRGLAMRSEMTWDEMLTIAGRLCGQSDLVMGELSFADMQAINILIGGFLGGGEKATGETPSP